MRTTRTSGIRYTSGDTRYKLIKKSQDELKIYKKEEKRRWTTNEQVGEEIYTITRVDKDKSNSKRQK